MEQLTEEQKILSAAGQLFMRIGIKSVSMDDIARELGMSKKTIYKYFKDKATLLTNVLGTVLNKQQQMCWSSVGKHDNALQGMIDLSQFVNSTHKDMNPTVLFDLRKYYPQLWSKIDGFRRNFIADTIKTNLEDGQKQGWFRPELDPAVIAQLYITLINGVIEQVTIGKSPFDFSTLHRQMIHYHLHGICTPKGLEYLAQHIHEI